VSVDVIPSECDAAIQIYCPIFGKCICRFYALDEMINIVFTDIFDSKIVDDKGEQNGLSLVVPKAGHVHTFRIPEWSQFSLKALVCQNASLWEAPHGSSHFDVNVAVVCVLVQVVLLHRPSREI
jgi:hypothetical protein